MASPVLTQKQTTDEARHQQVRVAREALTIAVQRLVSKKLD
jgi:hypothetical protein